MTRKEADKRRRAEDAATKRREQTYLLFDVANLADGPKVHISPRSMMSVYVGGELLVTIAPSP